WRADLAPDLRPRARARRFLFRWLLYRAQRRAGFCRRGWRALADSGALWRQGHAHHHRRRPRLGPGVFARWQADRLCRRRWQDQFYRHRRRRGPRMAAPRARGGRLRRRPCLVAGWAATGLAGMVSAQHGLGRKPRRHLQSGNERAPRGDGRARSLLRAATLVARRQDPDLPLRQRWLPEPVARRWRWLLARALAGRTVRTWLSAVGVG